MKYYIFIPYSILQIENLCEQLSPFKLFEAHYFFDRGIVFSVEQNIFNTLSQKYEISLSKIFKEGAEEYCYILF